MRGRRRMTIPLNSPPSWSRAPQTASPASERELGVERLRAGELRRRADPRARHAEPARVELAGSPAPPRELAHDRSRPRAREGVHHEIARVARSEDELADELDRKSTRLN